jgi:hypothetical protein
VSNFEFVLDGFGGDWLEATGRGKGLFVRSVYQLFEELGPLGKLVAVAERWLDLAVVLERVAVGVDEVGVDHEPEVVSVVSAVEAQSNSGSAQLDDGAQTRRGCVARVEGLHFLVDLELVGRGLSALAKAGPCRCGGAGGEQVLGPREVLVCFVMGLDLNSRCRQTLVEGSELEIHLKF